MLLERGRPLPGWYLDEPDLLPGDFLFIRAFFALSTCRAVGMGAGPIPWTAITEYADRLGLSWAMRRLFEDVMASLDETYMDWMEQQSGRDRRRVAATSGLPPSAGRSR